MLHLACVAKEASRAAGLLQFILLWKEKAASQKDREVEAASGGVTVSAGKERRGKKSHEGRCV